MKLRVSSWLLLSGLVCLSLTCVTSPARAQSQKAIVLNNAAIKEHYRGNYQSALEMFDQALLLAPNSKTSLLGRAVTLRELERYEEALAGLDKALANGNDADRIELERARTYLDMGDTRKATASVNRALQLNPDDGFIWNAQGMIHHRNGKWTDAIKSYNKAIEVGLTSPAVMVNRARAFRENKQYAEALADLNEVITADPDKPYARLDRIRVYRMMGQPQKTLPDYAVLIRAEPTNPEYLISRGRMWLGESNYDQAVADFTKAKALHSPLAAELITSVRVTKLWDSSRRITTQVPGKGDIRLDGVVTRVLTDRFTLNTTAFTTDAGHTKKLPDAKPKEVLLIKSAEWVNGGAGTVSPADLKPGTKVSAIGKDGAALQLKTLFFMLNRETAPTLPAAAIGRPTFSITVGTAVRELRAGTAFAARLEGAGKFLLTAHHLLGEAGGLDEDLEPDAVGEALKQVTFSDLAHEQMRFTTGAYIKLAPKVDYGDDDERDDLAAFALPDEAAASATLPLATTAAATGTAAWIVGKESGKKGREPDMIAATVVGSDETRLLLMIDSMQRFTAFSGAPVVNANGEVIGMLLASASDIVICNPAPSMAARLKAAGSP